LAIGQPTTFTPESMVVVPSAPVAPSPPTPEPGAAATDARPTRAPAVRAWQETAPIRLLVAGVASVALAAIGWHLVPAPAGLRLSERLLLPAAVALGAATLGSSVLVRRWRSRTSSPRLEHTLAAIDALLLGTLVVVFGAPTLALVPLLTLVPMAAVHAGTTQRLLAWHTVAFLLASEVHVRVRPLGAPALPEVWLGASGLLLVTGLALWQAHRQRAGARRLRDRIATRAVATDDADGLRPSPTAGGAASPTLPAALQPVADAIEAWRWSEREQQRSARERERDRAELLSRVQAELLALHERACGAARDADAMHEALAQSARAMTEGARAARAARAAGEVAAGSADVAAETAQRLARATPATRERMERASRTLRALAGDLPRLATEMSTLGPVTDDVGAHALTLDRLARQTTQLALNASIEAQRAGPYGIGFGVVADEMQRLAAENAHVTARLTACIAAVRDGVHVVATRLERSGAGVTDIDEVIADSRQALDALQRDITQVVERTDAAMRQARAQADGSASVLIAADGLDERTQRAVLEARRTAHLLSAHATDLHALQQAMRQLESARPRGDRAATSPPAAALTPTRRVADAPRAGGAPGGVRDVA